MDTELHLKYKDVKFNDPLILDMFSDIVEEDEVLLKVLVHIRETIRLQQSVKKVIGVSVSDIINNVEVTRQLRKTKGNTYVYELAVTNIHRKTAEKIADKLQSMSLIYYTELKPYKYFHITERGDQVVKRIANRKKEKKMNGDEK